MSLSCSCAEWDGDGWFHTGAEDFVKLETKKRKRCCSCHELINIGSDCLIFYRYRGPATEIELKIFGDGGEIDIASWYMCERCGEQYLNLDALGYCVDISENMLHLLAEYRELHSTAELAA